MPICRAYARRVLDSRPADAVYRRLCAFHFWMAHHYWPRLEQPASFSEKVWHRMLYQRDPVWTRLSDKLQMRDHVAQRVGEQYLIPLLWRGQDPEAIPFDALPSQFVVKATHGSKYNILVRNEEDRDPDRIRRQLRAWLGENFCEDKFLGAEWGYKHVKPAIMIEAFIGGGGGGGMKPPDDYKFFCYAGRAEFVQVNFDRFGCHQEQFFDREFKRANIYQLGLPQPGEKTPRPQNYDALVDVADRLSEGLDFIRVDLYSVGDKIYAGELTPYPTGGDGRFALRESDDVLGAKWTVSSPMESEPESETTF